MFTELLQAEVWRKRLESAGFRVILEPWEPPLRASLPPDRPSRERISQPVSQPPLSP